MLLHLSWVSQTVVILICSSLLFQFWSRPEQVSKVTFLYSWGSFVRTPQSQSSTLLGSGSLFPRNTQTWKKFCGAFEACKSAKENMSTLRNFNELSSCLYILFVVVVAYELCIKSTLSVICASFCRVLDGELTLFWSQLSQTGMPASSF